jgi:hypothetical protein
MLAAAAAKALTLRLVDVTPGANIPHHLREWAGAYTLTPDGPDSFTVTFTDPKTLRAVSDMLAGGIRGVFRVERGSAAAAAAAGSSGSSGTAAGVWGAGGGSSSSSSSVKAPPAGGPKLPKAAGLRSSSVSTAAAAAASVSGWQVIGSSKRSSAAAAVPAAAMAPDPWADDEATTAAARGSNRLAAAAAGSVLPQCVADDWESALDAERDVALPARPAVNLDQRNMWEALGDEA